MLEIIRRSVGRPMRIRQLLRTFVLSSSGRSATIFSNVLSKCFFATSRSVSKKYHRIFGMRLTWVHHCGGGFNK
jgi:hypothetical protein